jgi:hypothetical protein
MKVTIYFPNDPSVGIFSTWYGMEIPDFREFGMNEKELREFREEMRDKIKSLYTELDGEFTCRVWFEDENF